MGLFSSSSKSSQTEEGDIIFNNAKSSNTVNAADGSVGGGYQGSAGGPLENFNVGRGNKLYKNSFEINMTDSDAVANALKANEAVTNSANSTVQKGAAYAIGSNEATAARAIDASTTSNLINAEVADRAISQVQATASEAVKAAEQAQQRMAAQQGAFANNLAGLANAGTSAMSSLTQNTTSSVFDMSKDVLGTYESLVGRTGQQLANVLNQSNDQVTQTLDYSENATNKAMDYVFKSTQSASERTADGMMKYAAYAAVGLGVVGLVAVWRGN